MPTPRSPVDIFVVALHRLSEGRPMRGFMVATLARALDVGFDQAEAIAAEAAKAGLLKHQVHTVMLTAAGHQLAARFAKPTAATSAATATPGRSGASRARSRKARPRDP